MLQAVKGMTRPRHAETGLQQGLIVCLAVIGNQHIQHKRDTDTFRWGQFYAMLAVVGVLGLCTYMVTLNCAGAAATIGVAAIVGVIVAFHNKKPENTARNKNSESND